MFDQQPALFQIISSFLVLLRHDLTVLELLELL